MPPPSRKGCALRYSARARGVGDDSDWDSGFFLSFLFFSSPLGLKRFASHGRREEDRATRCVRKYAVASEMETPRDSKNRLKNPSRKAMKMGFVKGGRSSDRNFQWGNRAENRIAAGIR